MKIYWNAFKHSIRLPQKQSVFALNRIGMDITVIYIFILLALASLPALYTQIIESSSASMHIFFLLIYFFIFYYLILVLIVFSAISIVSYIGALIAKGIKRKLRYSILWKITAFTTTLPFIVFTFLSILFPLSNWFVLLATIYVFVILIKIILIYPKRRIRSSN